MSPKKRDRLGHVMPPRQYMPRLLHEEFHGCSGGVSAASGATSVRSSVASAVSLLRGSFVVFVLGDNAPSFIWDKRVDARGDRDEDGAIVDGDVVQAGHRIGVPVVPHVVTVVAGPGRRTGTEATHIMDSDEGRWGVFDTIQYVHIFQ